MSLVWLCELGLGMVTNAGNEEVAALYMMYRVRLLKTIARYVDCPSEREDVLHDVFVRVERSLKGFRADCAIYTWLHRIAINVSINHLRKHRNRGKYLELVEADQSHFDTPEEIAVAWERVQRIERAFSSMSIASQTTLTLRSIDGLSYASIAETTGVAAGTVRSRLNRARSVIQATNEQES